MPDLKIAPELAPLHAALINKDVDALRACLADDVVFRPPTYWKDWEGPETTLAILGHVMELFEDFHYKRIWNDHPDYALEFKTRIGDLDAEGVDLITLNEDGKVAEFTVVMRPIKTVEALRRHMTERFQKAAMAE